MGTLDRCPVLIPMMVVPPDLPQVEGGAAAKVDGGVLLAHAPIVIVREGLVGSAIIAYGVEIMLQEDPKPVCEWERLDERSLQGTRPIGHTSFNDGLAKGISELAVHSKRRH